MVDGQPHSRRLTVEATFQAHLGADPVFDCDGRAQFTFVYVGPAQLAHPATAAGSAGDGVRRLLGIGIDIVAQY